MKPNDIKDPHKSAVNSADEALRQSRQVLEAVDVAEKKKEEEGGGRFKKFAAFAENIALIAGTIRGIRAGLGWIKSTVIQPIMAIPVVGKLIPMPFKMIGKSYYNFTHPYENETLWQASKNSITHPFRRAANNVANAFRRDDVPFQPDLRARGPLSKTRAGIAALTTIWALSGVFRVPVVGDAFNYGIAGPAVDIPRVTATALFNAASGQGFSLKKDTLYFGLPHKDDGQDIYHVTASEQRSSSEENSLSFVVRDRAVNEIWSWLNGHGPFRPDYVVAPIRPDANKCVVTSYGSRWKIARWASFKPDLLGVSCSP